MNDLTPDQARALWDAGGFVVLTDLPEGSEFGIDGTFNLVRKFSGVKFVPPGIHIVTWSPPSSSSSSSNGNPNQAGPSSLPIRSALIKNLKPRERLVLRYDTITESVSVIGSSPTTTTAISDDSLRSLDGELASYPFAGLEKWKSLTEHIDEETLVHVLEEDGRVDGLTPAEGEESGVEEGLDALRKEEGKQLQFPVFNIKRSWRDGAVGEEVTRYSRDKSWLLSHVVQNQLGGDPLKLIAHLQLSFTLLLYLSSYSALMVYKRLLMLLTQSSSLLLDPLQYFPAHQRSTTRIHVPIAQTYIALIASLTAQICSIPDGTFETELPELDVFYLDALEQLRSNLVAGIYQSPQDGSPWKQAEIVALRRAWTELRDGTRRRWGWSIGDLSPRFQSGESSEEEEEGEYAPVVVRL